MKNRKILTLFASFILFTISIVNGQTAPFQVAIEPMSIPSLGGLQSFAVGQHNEQWLLVGGRLDGLHRRQPFAAFDVAGNNNQLIVVDPNTKQKWTAPLTSLAASIQEHLSSTNIQFYQEGEYLYLIGGYGYSAINANHITFPNLTAIQIPMIINAIKNGSAIAPFIRQMSDTLFAVTGGSLKKINQTFYLVGGQKFIGRYNPMGPTSGPGFFQEYTNAIRKFRLSDNGTQLSITHLPSLVDAINLHRRDYNVVPQILPTLEEGITAFSGVFQPTADLPYLNCVTIDSVQALVNNAFAQYYNHYHCANIPLYSASQNEMHTVFFGGIAQYYDKQGTLVQDNNVPFVNTIARVTRKQNGEMAEYKLPIEMPGLLGSGSEFIPVKTIAHYANEVIKLDNLTNDTNMVGYIFGGISSSAPNIFFTNTGTQSAASNQIFKVYIIKNSLSGLHQLNEQSTSSLHMQVYPNPNNGHLFIKFNILYRAEPITLSIQDNMGKIIKRTTLENLKMGENIYSQKMRGLANGGTYYVTIETSKEKSTQKVIINP
ncbi:MAG: T9SS type A sorting domain-containing protein [Bacteroidota bacterium]|nr:T9SS type A sorting domain-containing protein [Bacteroidota bacterium]